MPNQADVAYETGAELDWVKAARHVLMSRRLDELETTRLAPAGKIKYQFSAGGHELAQALLAQALTHPKDAAAVYYRSRPFLLSCGLTVVEALAGGMARQHSPSGGRDVGVVFNLPARGGPTILPASGNVGAQFTPAAGWAQAICYRSQTLGESDWAGAVAVALGGDGSTAANGFWAALNIAATLNLPMLFFIEDNEYGISVPASLQTPGGDIAANLGAFRNLCIRAGDGAEPKEAWTLISGAVAHVRSGAGPCLLRLRLPRLAGHTMIDDQAYKSAAERQADQVRDPLPRLKAYLVPAILSEQAWADLEEEVESLIAAANAEAQASPDPDPAVVGQHVFYNGHAPQQGGLRPEGALPGLCDAAPAQRGPRINLIDAVRLTLEAELRLNPRLLVFGEDVGVKGGVHGATHDLQRHFGRSRVFDTSLSEDGIIGRSTGMALAGLLPVPEIQFRKYADPAHEQLSDLGTLRWRTANHFAAPVVVRMPVGYGKRTGDPWHSVCGEAVFAHLPGWRIAFPSNAEDAAGLLRAALRGDDPVFFLEHRGLYDTPEGRRPYPGDDYCLPFGQAALLQPGDELAVITWGETVHRCLEAAAGFERRVAILDLRTIAPWDSAAVLDLVRATGKALIVHEDTLTGGFGAEIAAVIAQQAFHDLDAPIVRLATPDHPIPYNIPAMESALPSPQRIRAEIQRMLDY